jgi:hypothetical protein
MQEGQCGVIAVLPVLGKSATSIEPADGAFDDPALRLDDEALGVVATPDDIDCQLGQDLGDAVAEDRSGIGAVGKQLAQERELSEQGGQQQHATVAVLHVGRHDQRVQHQAERVDEQVALLALDQLACIEAVTIDRRPPFSALFTLWLSMIATVGLASRPASSRHRTYSA